MQEILVDCATFQTEVEKSISPLPQLKSSNTTAQLEVLENKI